jgi:hypothetical protein
MKIEKMKVNLLMRRTLMCLLGGVIIASLVFTAVAGEDEPFEDPPFFRASQILPENLLTGPNWELNELVFNDGYNNNYNIITTYGDFTVDSTYLLKIRLHELQVLNQMEEVKRGKVYLKAVIEAGKGPFRFAKGLITRPIRTTSGVVSGVGSYFGNIRHSLFGSPSEREEGKLKTAILFSGTKRKVAYDFGIDPYSSNEPLQVRLDEITWAVYGGNMTLSAALLPIQGLAGTLVSVSSLSQSMRQMIRDNAPRELRKLNTRKLKKMGVDKSLAKAFLKNPELSPTKSTYIVGALELMDGAEDRGLFIVKATVIQEPSVGLYFQRQAELMASYHTNVAPVARIVESREFPFIQTKEGKVIGIFPIDHLAWIRSMADTVDISADMVLEGISGVTGKELWFEGTVSEMARKNLETRGWTVKEKVGDILTIE